MSRLAKGTLLTSILLSSLAIWGVHYLQNRERETMYKGVLRDDERRRETMRQRQEDFDQSRRKREQYERFQTVESEESSSDA